MSSNIQRYTQLTLNAFLVNAYLRKGRGRMRITKVFISSVNTGYKDRRDAAEDAINDLNRFRGFNFEAIRIEPDKHPAENKSSQKVCLNEVEACDIYLGIYGASYGWGDSPADISPTHEEFRAANGKKYCFIFVEKIERTKREPKQNEFLDEVGKYTKGLFWNKFETVGDLKHRITLALLNFMGANFEECLPNYLKSLLRKNERIDRLWPDDVDLLPVSEVVQLELRAKEQREENKSPTEYDEIERHSEKTPISLTFADAIEKKQRLLVIGDPGAGKSTSLQWITYSYAKQILNHSQKELPVPIYLNLKWYNGNLCRSIATHFAENGIECDEKTVTEWIKKEKFLFLLDGFDEPGDLSKCSKDIKELIGASSVDSRFVITSRKIEALKDFKSLKFERVEVKQLSDPKMELFAEKYLGKERGDRILKELKGHNLLTEARNPLILWFMILEFQRDESQICANKGMLFKNVIEHHFLKEWDKKVIPAKFDRQKYINLKIEVLSRLAFFMVVEGDFVKIEEGKAKEIIDDVIKEGRTNYKDIRDELLRQLFKSHILIKVGTELSFWHKSFRDYFAALELVEIFQRDPEELMNQYATERWEGAILFLVGIMDDPSDFVDRLIQPFWRNLLKYRSQVMFRLFLAAKCIGANNRVSIETQQIIIEQLKTIIQIWESKEKPDSLKSWVFSLYYTHRGAFQALGETKSEKAVDYLGERLETNKDGQRAVCALRNMPLTEKICNSLVYAALRHEDGVVRGYATEILDENMPQEIESKLLQVLNDRQEKNEVRVHALDVLSGNHSYNFNRLSMRKYSDEVICAIIKAALEDTGHLRSSAAWTLAVYGGKDKEERIINSLVHALLNNHNADIRTNAAAALLGHDSPRVLKALVQALDDESPKVQIKAAYILSMVGIKTQKEENEASQKLLSLFSDDDNTVRINAIATYGRIRRKPPVEELSYLINLLRDEDIAIRYYAAEALGHLKTTIALDALKQMVRNEKCMNPWASAIWAILQIEPSFCDVIKENCWEHPYILKLFNDDMDECKVAVEVLGKIGTEISLPFLKGIYEDYEKGRGMYSELFGELFHAIHIIEERIKRTST